MYNIGVRIKEDMIKVGDLVRFRGSDKPHCAHTSVAGKVYLVTTVEAPTIPGRWAHLRLCGPPVADISIETLLYPAYRFEVV
jgi:hypothetical protein|tara:strand:- start:19014 stop:19259 length:246 start_codon:yes stop_codon:yes gene_type:complete